jgi:ADP-heptose:LPS heptosyltransferase
LPKFLIIRFSSIGDIVLTTPVIRCIKNQVPGAEIHYLTKPAFETILSSNPYLDKVWLWNENPSQVIDKLKSERFDYAIDLHHNLRSARIKLGLGVKAFSFRKLNLEKYLYVNFKWNRLPDLHIVDRYFETISSFGIKNDRKGIDFFILPADEFLVTDFPILHQSGFVALVVGALKATKRMPVEKLIELCTLIKQPIVLLGGKAEMNDATEITTRMGPEVFNLVGRLNIAQSASVVKQAKVVITHDTGLMHIAAAFHKPIISIWGNTVPQFGMSPYMPDEPEKSFIAEVDGLSCRPCSKIGFSKCPKGHFKCMIDQDLNQIARQVGIYFSRKA